MEFNFNKNVLNKCIKLDTFKMASQYLQCSIQGRVITKTLKMVLDTSLLNTQQYKVSIKGKVGQSRVRSNALPYTSM